MLFHAESNPEKTILPIFQGAFFCRFREIKHDGAGAILDGAGSLQRKITPPKPLQDGVACIRRKITAAKPNLGNCIK